MSDPDKVCAITGTSGYVGGRLKAHLQRAGWRIVDWSRRIEPGPSSVKFQLGQVIDPRAFAGTRTLVHAAYDFQARSWEEIAATNVRGSEKLFRAAQSAGVNSCGSNASEKTNDTTCTASDALEIFGMCMTNWAISTSNSSEGASPSRSLYGSQARTTAPVTSIALS